MDKYDKIAYINNGQTFSPDTVSLESSPDGGICIYGYTEMTNPRIETKLVENITERRLTEQHKQDEYFRVRFMQCGVHLNADVANQLLLALMNRDNYALIRLKARLKRRSPEMKEAVKKDFTAVMQYLFEDDASSGSNENGIGDRCLRKQEEETEEKLIDYQDWLNSQRKNHKPSDR